jgi:hypothetical protein
LFLTIGTAHSIIPPDRNLQHCTALHSDASPPAKAAARGGGKALLRGSTRTKTHTLTDPWSHACVWVSRADADTDTVWVGGSTAKSEDDLWLPGTCVSHCLVLVQDTGRDAAAADTGTGVRWTFTIDLTRGGRIEVASVATDASCSEFAGVKRRDEHMNASSIKDMTYLSYLNEPEMLECLRRRYAASSIYTSTGPILVAINPFRACLCTPRRCWTATSPRASRSRAAWALTCTR